MGAWLENLYGRRGRLLSLLLLVTILATHLPLPHRVVRPVEKDRSRPFPCQDRLCGCRTAEQCWQRCCCFTREQKLAWIQLHAAPLSQQTRPTHRQHHLVARDQHRRSCCRTSEQPAATVRSLSRRLLSGPDHGPQEPAGRKGVESVPQGGAILAFVAHSCQGQPWGWNTLDCQAVPVDPHIACPVSGLPEASLSLTSDLLLARALEPPVPPPRLTPHVGFKV